MLIYPHCLVANCFGGILAFDLLPTAFHWCNTTGNADTQWMPWSLISAFLIPLSCNLEFSIPNSVPPVTLAPSFKKFWYWRVCHSNTCVICSILYVKMQRDVTLIPKPSSVCCLFIKSAGVSAKCHSVSVCVKAKGLKGTDVCLLSEEVCNSVWQWVIDSESQGQTLLRKHSECACPDISLSVYSSCSLDFLWISMILQSGRIMSG